ncbi:MAG: ABC transporter permease [Myxococcales bacterium]|nr:ABC transporter permease [Myxococcales bacterium]
MAGPLTRIGALAQKELAHIRRDPQMLAFALLLPLLLLLLFGYAISFDVDRIPLAVVDQDGTPQSRALVRDFTAGGLFVEVGRGAQVADVEPLLRQGEARAALVIDGQFAQRHLRGEPAPVQLLLDGADNSTASVALGYATALATPPPPVAPVELRARALFNPGLRSAVFVLPGLIVFLLVMIAVMLTALTVAREFERGSMEQLFATPVKRGEIILGKLLPYFGLGALQVLLVLTAGVTLFGLPVRGSLALLAAVASLFLLANLAQGLLISVVTRSQMIASQVAVLSTLLPALLLSGFVFPIANMPMPLQVLAQIFPASHLVSALRAILLRGNGVEALWADLGAIAAFLAVMLAVAIKKFKREATG